MQQVIPDIHITLVNYLMKDDILSILADIQKDIEGSEYSVTVSVVDNSDNADGIETALAPFSSFVHYINPKANLGYGKAMNLGFARQEARYYFVLNPDTALLPHSRTIDHIIKKMDTETHIGAMGIKTLNFDGSLQHTCFRFDWGSILVKPLRQVKFDSKFRKVKQLVERLEMHDFDHNETIPVDWILGAGMVVRKEVTEKIGFFDEQYFMYLEDCDWCMRMWEAHFAVYYVHDIVMKHKHNRGSSKVRGVLKALLKNKLARIHLASWLRFIWKWKHTLSYYDYRS